MKTVIMAGGQGTRLRPLTSNQPKPMIPIVNTPCMEHIVRLLKDHGFTEIVVTLQFMPEEIQYYFGDGSDWGVSIGYSIEDAPAGTAGSVKLAEEHLEGERVLVISGDADAILTDGVKLNLEGDAWVLMLPDPDNLLLHVYAEADGSGDGSEGLVSEYAQLVEGLIRSE